MIEWEVGSDHLRVTDQEGAEVGIAGKGLSVDVSATELGRPVDETLETTISQLQVPRGDLTVHSLGGEADYELAAQGERSIPPGEYLLELDAQLSTYIRFSGSATLSRGMDGTEISFATETRVVLGFRSDHSLPTARIIVPNDLADVASAITHLASAHKTASPDRSFPAFRGHPPLVNHGEEFAVPDELTAESGTGVELVVPPDYGSLFVTAPLAYYLGASVQIGGHEPRLRVPDAAVERELSPLPALEDDVERLLRKTFFMDCLVRSAGPYGTEVAELSMLEALEIDPAQLYEADMQERLATYLEIPYEAIEHRLPDWHLATYVEPTYETVETLPFLLDRLSLLYTPRTSELEGRELVRRSLDDFYRAGAGEVASVDVVKPELRTGRCHGWLGEGVPIDVFKSTPEAYRNHLRFLGREDRETTICVVLNDPDMEGERQDVAAIYESRAEQVPIDLTVEESIGTGALARRIESECDFLHYIGHCEREGLRCPDGYLSTSSLERSNVQTFFLNACGSFYEGMNLIEKGSVAGAVTFTTVLNDHAVTVGSTFARLLMHGFSIERAMSLARRRIMMGKDYAVVGDGTHTLTDGDNRPPMTARLETMPDEQYLLTVDCFDTRSIGSHYRPPTGADELAHLCGNRTHLTAEPTEVGQFLAGTSVPVIFDGDLCWSHELVEEFVDTPPAGD